MNQPPAFQFYADDFIAGVADMTQNEVGAYIMLLAHSWNTRGLDPTDPARLKLLAKGDVSEHVLRKFKLRNGRLYNPRQEKERRKQVVYRLAQAVNGAKGGRPSSKPKPNPSLSSGLSQIEPKKSSPSPSPSPVSKEEKKGLSFDLQLLKTELGSLFKRNGRPWNYEEEFALSEICQSGTAAADLRKIIALRERMSLEDRHFFPRSVISILRNWNKLLDTDAIYQTPKTPDERKAIEAALNRWK